MEYQEQNDALYAPNKNLPIIQLPEPFDEMERKLSINSRIRFGTPVNKPVAIPPNQFTDEFQYPLKGYSYDNLSDHLVPPPLTQNPPLGCYPTALEYRLTEDGRFMSERAYVADYDVSFSEAHREQLLAIQTPPECVPSLVNGRYILKPIPGMIQLVPGIPFAIYPNGDKDRIQTVACLHTLRSLKQYPDYDDIWLASVKLACLTWGTPTRNGKVGIPPIYSYDLKTNDRHAARATTHVSTLDGSFSLGNTVMKGDGLGTVLPAVQVDNPTASSQIRAILQTLHALHRLVLPKSISKFEYDICDFHWEYMNAFGFGGLDPAATSVQLNLSSLGANLEDSIGDVQGLWHSDINDDPNRFTLFILLLRVGPTGHPGSFCLARWGLYAAEIGCWVIFLAFKGVDLHSGFAPQEQLEAHQEFVQQAELYSAYNLAGPANRAGYVLYTSRISIDRTGSLNATIPTLFGNISSSMTPMERYHNFGHHGPRTLGTHIECANRLAREAVYAFYNALCASGLHLDLDLNDLMRSISITDNEEKVQMSPVRYNPQQREDGRKIQRLLSLYEWHSQQCYQIYIRITKENIRARRKELLSGIQDLESRNNALPDSLIDVSADDITGVVKHVRGRNDKAYPLHHYGQLIKRCIRSGLDTPKLQQQAPVSLHNTSFKALSNSAIGAIPIKDVSLASLSTTEGSDDSPEVTLPQREQHTSSLQKTVAQTEDVTKKPPSRPIKRLPSKGTRAIVVNNSRGQKRSHAETVSDQEHAVKAITSHKFDPKMGLLELQVQWVQDNEVTWEPVHNLRNCLELLIEYTESNCLALPSHMLPKKTRLDGVEGDTLELANNLHSLRTIVDATELRQEAAYLEDIYASRKLDSSVWKSPALSHGKLIQELDNLSASHQLIDTYQPILIKDNPITINILKFTSMNQSIQEVPNLERANWTADFIDRAIQAETCLTWVSVYEWYYVYGSRLTEDIMSICRKKGISYLKEHLPIFAVTVNCIVHYLASSIQSQLAAAPNVPEQKRRTITLETQNVIRGCDPISFLPTSTIPADLGGLAPHAKGPTWDLAKSLTKPFKFGASKKLTNNVEDYIFTQEGPSLLQEVISERLIIPQLRRFDVFTPAKGKSARRTRISNEDVRKRAVIRGALLFCLQQICGGPAIFFADKIKKFLSSPPSIISTYGRDDIRMADTMLKDKRLETHFAPVLQTLYEIVKAFPDIIDSASSIQHTVLRTIGGLSKGYPPLDDDDDDISGEDVADHPSQRSPPKPIDLKGLKGLETYRPSWEALIQGSQIGLGSLGLIVRAALNLKRRQSPSRNEVHRVLLGQHPTLSSETQRSVSHTDPIRQHSEYAHLFECYLPQHLLSRREGLSNILSYMGTGQGCGTLPFLSSEFSLKPDKFFASSLSNMVQNFQSAVSRNIARFGSTLQAGKAGFIPVFDTTIWGQPSRSFSLAPEGADKYQGVRHKFEPYWTETVQDSWVSFVTPNPDPNSATPCNRKKPTWTEAFQFLVDLRISGFRSGLTVFQCANNLALAGICDMPSCIELVNWIVRHKKLGAWKALKNLGLQVGDKSGLGAYASFYAIYRHLDVHLSDQDKTYLGFNPMFVEHLLCKVTRYSKRWADFESLALSEEESSAEWEQGKNETDNLAFPFPLTITKDALEAYLEDFNPSTSKIIS